MKRRLALGLNAVIIAVTDDEPSVLTVDRDGTAVGLPSLPAAD